MIGTTINNYKIVKIIGKGGMGNVYLAEHVTLNRKAAIKLLHLDLTQKEQVNLRFVQEAKLLDELEHANIVRLIDFGIHEGRPYLLMEYIEGRAFDEHIKTVSGPVPEEKALEYILQVLKAVGYAHKKGIVHRDIKPSNFMITPQNKIKILDFGIAKIISDDADSLKTKTGQRIGSLAYMSPEQIKGAKIDGKTDIYSIGVALMQMVTGKEPYSKEMSEWDLSHEIVYEKLPRIKDIYPHASDSVQNIIDKATAKKREDRYATCEEFSKAVQAVINILESSKEVPQELVEMIQEFAQDGILSKAEEISLQTYAKMHKIDYAGIILPLFNSEIEKTRKNKTEPSIVKEEKIIDKSPIDNDEAYDNTSTIIEEVIDDNSKTRLFDDDDNGVIPDEVQNEEEIAPTPPKKKSKLPLVIGAVVVIIALAAFFIIPGILEKQAFDKAVSDNSIEALEDYINDYSDGEFVEEANDKIEEIYFEAAESDNTIEEYTNYINDYPDGEYVDEAKENISLIKEDDYNLYTEAGDENFNKGEKSLKMSLESYKLALNTGFNDTEANRNIRKVEFKINSLVVKYKKGIKQLVPYFGECDNGVKDYCKKILILKDDAEASRILNKCN